VLLRSGDTVRLTEPTAGMPAGSEGVLVGWFMGDDRVLRAIVRFWDGGPLTAPASLLEYVHG
jgi:hypothetical protein